MSMRALSGLETLPVELLYELQLHALSQFFPYTSRRIYAVFRSSPSFFRAQYIIGRVKIKSPDFYTKVLRYPLCTKEVLDAICHQHPRPSPGQICDLPRRWFRSLIPKVGALGWKKCEEPLPFLQYLFQSSNIPPVNVNSYEGYALIKAVHARFIPLVQFLLDHGASPQSKDGLAVTVAIRQNNLSLVKLLIEQNDSQKTPGKRRKLRDRMEANKDMLKAAVRCDARDIVKYLMQEKRCVPDIRTLEMMVK